MNAEKNEKQMQMSLIMSRIMPLLTQMRVNLFPSPLATLVTIGILTAFASILWPVIRWGILDANFVGDTREACNNSGACWVFIRVWLQRLMTGLYPDASLWRITLCVILFLGLMLAGFLSSKRKRKWILLALLLYIPLFAAPIVRGGFFGLEEVGTRVWGGLFLTLFVAITAIIICFPLGIVLALGRRSTLYPVIRTLSILFIEFWRGVPLLSVLFMAAVMFPMFLPDGVTMDKLLRSILGIALFEASYMAEVIRGGLQAIPKGQVEAANALGLDYYQRNRLVILPQAIKHVLPGIANTFIALLKDTPLLAIIGLLDLLGIMQLANNNTNWQGFATEGYVVVALIFWFFCFTMSRWTQRLEKRMAKSSS